MIGYLPHLLLLLTGLGLTLPLFHKTLKKRLSFILSFVLFAIFSILVVHIVDLDITNYTLISLSYNIVPGITFDFRIDGLSVIFGLLISGIGGLVFLYAGYYMYKYERQGHFFFYLSLFTSSMLFLVFSDNLMALFIFWELTSVMSFLLIGFEHQHEKSRYAALQSLLITGFGGLCLLFAFILTGQVYGTYSVSALISQGASLVDHPQYRLIFGFILLAAFTKSAQFPFHFWLPGAMQAPTPVSAYLHSATMVNAGIFLLLRIHPFFGGTPEWKYSLVLTGAVTMFVGAFFSMGQKDLKRILAFTTISALGTMIMLLGGDSGIAIKATLVFFIVHGLYKGGLFMVAGIIDKGTGTRDITILSKLTRILPLTSIASVLALVSMAGLPPMLGFIGKELVYDAKLQLPGLGWIILPLVIGANVIMIAISLTIFFEIFAGKSTKEPVKVKHYERDFSWYFIAGPVILAVAGLFLGLFPGLLDNLVGNALYAVRSEIFDVHLSLWHGFNDALLLSIVTVLAGIVVFLYRYPITAFFVRQIEHLNRFHMPTIFIKVMNFYLSVAAKNTRRLQHGYHRLYLITFFVITSVMTIFMVDWGSLFDIGFSIESSSSKAGLLILIIIASFAAIYGVFSNSRLSAIVALGAVGYIIGLIYLLFGAIDLAITQLLVETVVMILFVMVIYYLPNFMIYSKTSTRVRDVFIALGVGVMVFFVVLHARFINLHSPISDFFAQNSLTEAHGRNIVNVILVDFRALDTLGEITVLALAAVGVYSLYKFKVKQ